MSCSRRDTDGALLNLMNVTPDGDYQTFKTESGAYVRENFFGRDERALALVKDYSDDQIWGLKRGGHDYRKVYAAYKAAVEHKGQPTVIIAKTIKGYGLGPHFEGRNATHQMKKMTLDDLKHFRDGMHIPISDAQLEENPYLPPYYNPGQQDETIQYLMERRRALGGFLPERRSTHVGLALPDDSAYTQPKKGSGTQEIATTMAFVRLLKDLLRAKDFGHRIVPIIPDEARTFGMDAFFPTAKIYNPNGQHYTSVDRELLLAYKESPQGQILHVGINEAGAMAAFTGVGTSYSTHGEPLIPVYIFYSMFGFQRTGDAQWAAGDQMARGFIIGATAGRTTLTGEGLQHADGHSHLLASTNPATLSFDPAYGYEIAHIVRSGLDRMYGGQHPDPNVMYYLTVYNEPLVQPAEPADVDVDGIVRGIHRISVGEGDGPRAQLLASGVGVPWALEAQQLLKDDWGVIADVWSVTSWTELRRDGLAADEHNFLHPGEEPRTPYITEKLRDAAGPVVAVSDYMHAVQDQIRPWVPNRFATLGADGFGFSDTRPAARRFFKIDGPSVVVRTLQSLAEDGVVDRSLAAQAIDEVPTARRDRRHKRQRGRRELTRGMASRPTQMDKPRRSLGCGGSRAIWRPRRSSAWRTRSPGTPKCRRRGGRPSVWSHRRASRRSSSGTTTPPPHRGSPPTSSQPLLVNCCRSVSLTQTLQLIRVTVEVTEERLVGKGDDLREGILLYSRDVAFAAADVYARAAEARGLWDARLEALVVDSILTGEADEELPSRIAALGWHGHGEVAVLVGTTPPQFDVDQLRRSARKAGRRRAHRRAGIATRARARPRRAARSHRGGARSCRSPRSPNGSSPDSDRDTWCSARRSRLSSTPARAPGHRWRASPSHARGGTRRGPSKQTICCPSARLPVIRWPS